MMATFIRVVSLFESILAKQCEYGMDHPVILTHQYWNTLYIVMATFIRVVSECMQARQCEDGWEKFICYVSSLNNVTRQDQGHGIVCLCTITMYLW